MFRRLFDILSLKLSPQTRVFSPANQPHDSQPAVAVAFAVAVAVAFAFAFAFAFAKS